ncbi:MAG: 30S ribosomal protein S2 [Candidatus Liptonbacteria bacterium]|nr:30S ribosomal protein S2 [Candidatus Liptonbacteria bacterium]
MPNDPIIEKTNSAQLVEDSENSAGTTPVSFPAINQEDEALIQEMIRAGLLYGKAKSKTHPRAKQFVFTTRNYIEIIDLVKTVEYLRKALDFLNGVAAKGGQILFVGTQPAAKASIVETAKNLNQLYVSTRWLGGTLTNFGTISKRIAYFKKLKEDQKSGALDKYTKKERVDFNREISKLTLLFSGLESMNQLPDALLVINSKLQDTAVREAKRVKIPVVALMSTDQNPDGIDYPIPGNDSAPMSIKWVLAKVHESLKNVKPGVAPIPAKPNTANSDNLT